MSIQLNYSNLNGELIESDKPLFTLANRAFRYGDGVFESIRIVDGKVPFLPLHVARLKRACEFLKLNAADFLKEEIIAQHLKNLMEKNKILQGGKIRITVFREDGGLYTPLANKAKFSIEAVAIEHNQFELNTKGLQVELYSEIKKQIHPLSNFKTNNCLTYVMAGIYKTENKFDDCILLNDKSHVCEAISSNLFLVINGALYTPTLSEGCLDGVMRKIILETAPKHRINIYEPAILPNDLLRADEVFLTNSINGIQWVGSYKNKRYFNTTSKKINAIINDLVH